DPTRSACTSPPCTSGSTPCRPQYSPAPATGCSSACLSRSRRRFPACPPLGRPDTRIPIPPPSATDRPSPSPSPACSAQKYLALSPRHALHRKSLQVRIRDVLHCVHAVVCAREPAGVLPHHFLPLLLRDLILAQVEVGRDHQLRVAQVV